VPGQSRSSLDSLTSVTTDQFLTSGSSVYGETDTATDVSTYYQAGCFGMGSFALSSVTSTETYSALYCYQGSDTQVQGGPQTQTLNESGFTLSMVAGFQQRGSYTQVGTVTGSAADTSLDSYNGSGAQTWTSQQAGSLPTSAAATAPCCIRSRIPRPRPIPRRSTTRVPARRRSRRRRLGRRRTWRTWVWVLSTVRRRSAPATLSP
jgi:hypothetical protein